MPGAIYTMQDEKNLIRMEELSYDSESVLQGLLAQYPDLLAGDQINAEDPRRWVLVGTEVAVPGDDSGSGRWSVDHLFLDQDAVPTIVEVKRSTDTRVRREVVGQMLDYAANAVAYWPVEQLRTRLEATCAAQGRDLEEVLGGLLGDDNDPDPFWKQAQLNMLAGKLRLVFVADVIPPELQRIIEFMNTHMETVEVVGIEVRQYAGSGLRTLVPRVVGYVQRPSTTSQATINTNREEFMAALDNAGVAFFGKVFALADTQGLPIHWGTRGFSLNVDSGGRHAVLLYGYPPSSVFGQSIYTDFATLGKKVDEALVDWYRQEMVDLGGFVPTGTGNLKRMVDAGLAGSDGDKLVDIVSSVVKMVRNPSQSSG